MPATRKKIVIIVIIAAIVACLVILLVLLAARKPQGNLLTVSGNIEAHESLVGFKVQGRLEDLPVQEGRYVRAGDLIARLDRGDYEQQVKIDEALLNSRMAELNLALAGTRDQEIKAAEQSVLEAKADLELKEVEFRRNQALYAKNALVSAETRDTAETNLKRARTAHERASQAYNELQEGTRKEQIAINRANVQTARQSLDLSRIRLSYTALYAPKTGVVTVRQAELGEVMLPGSPVVTIADIDHLWLRGYINETDLGRVRWGQAATVTTDTFPQKKYRGRISFISSVAEFTPKSVETHKERVTLVYRIKIDLENPDHELKPGMPADAVIEGGGPLSTEQGNGHAIAAAGLTMEFPGVTAVDALSFDVGHGEIFGLVGPDGAGKTTTIRMLAGVLTPTSGSADIAGFDVTRDPEGVKHQISYMSQRFGLYEDLTVEENIRFYAGLFGLGRADMERRASRLLAAAGMAPFGKRLAGQLSGGMKQKLGLVCALIHTPKVILLDEPTNGVDPVSRRDFWAILYALLDEKIAILISTSYLDEAERCHRVALLHQGRLLYVDTPEGLRKRVAGEVVSVISPEPRRLEEALTGADGISSILLVGDRLRLLVDDASRRVPELQARLTSMNAPFDRIEQTTATIEDLFVQAIARESAGAGHA